MTTSVQNQLIINSLRPLRPERIGLFGSYARGENGSDSDLDILIKLPKPVSLLTLVRVERELSELLQLKVDLMTEGVLKNERFRTAVFQDLKAIKD